MILTVIVAALSIVALGYAAQLLRAAAAARSLAPNAEGIALGAVTNFFDTLGIGSFAPSIAWMRLRRLMPDRLIPLTMLAGYILPALLQGIIFMILLGVRVDPLLLLGCIVAMVAGAWISPGLAARAPVRLIQAIVGAALLLAAAFYAMSNLGLMPAGGTATSLPPAYAALAIALHFLFGVLIAFGVGNYAPTLAALSLMGMDPRLAFPIMAAAAGFSGTVCAYRSFRLLDLDYRLVLGLALGAIPAVLVAAFIVKELPLEWLRWLVVVVVTYAGITLLLTAARKAQAVPEDPAETALL